MLFPLINGCVNSPQTNQLFTQKLTMVPSAEITATPFFAQEDYQCGPAALATVLNYRGRTITPAELVSAVYIPDKKGSLQIEMTATARRYGLLAYPIAPSLEDLLREIAAGNPVLVMQNLSFNWYPMWHYAVVVGYDMNTQTIILRSGKTKRWKTSFTAFENTWQRSHEWGLVIVPPALIPATANPIVYLSAARDLETTGQMAASLTAYHRAVTRWPEEPATWLALGNALYAQKDFSAASHVLHDALTHHPKNSNLWNNYAYALVAEGCTKTAQQALQNGLKYNPGDANLLDSRKDLQKYPTLNKTPCPI